MIPHSSRAVVVCVCVYGGMTIEGHGSLIQPQGTVYLIHALVIVCVCMRGFVCSLSHASKFFVSYHLICNRCDFWTLLARNPSNDATFLGFVLLRNDNGVESCTMKSSRHSSLRLAQFCSPVFVGLGLRTARRVLE